MSRSMTIRKSPAWSTTLTISVLVLSALLTACDGGLFGTGDGDSDIVASTGAETADPGLPLIVDPAESPDTGSTDADSEDPVSDQPATDPVQAPAVEPTESDPIEPAPTEPEETSPSDTVQEPPPAIEFSNTTPSGIENSESLLPALKLINLSGVTLNAVSDSELEASDEVSVATGQTSDFLSLNTGESVITIDDVDESVPLAIINPLNAVQDSITTVIATLADSSVPGDSTGVDAIDIRVVDTRAAVSAANMAEVRLIFTTIPGELPETQFTLTPDSGNGDGTVLVFSSTQDDGASVIGYQLATPGDYVLSDSDGFFTPQTVQLQANTVNSIIITSSFQPAFVEVDSDVQ